MLFAMLEQQLGFTEQQVRSFKDDFEGSMNRSIDLFLGRRPEYAELGKLCIAFLIGSCENPAIISNIETKNDWYYYLWNQLVDNHSWEEFRKCKLSIVTFNYDRSFEYFMHRAMMKTFGKSSEECADMLQSTIRIVHMYGSIGEPIYVSKNGRPYEQGFNAEGMRTAASHIRVIPEDRTPDDPLFGKARQWLRESEIIAFLGFGYDSVNIERLGVRKLCAQSKDRFLKEMYGTTLGLMGAEYSRAVILTGVDQVTWPCDSCFKSLDCLGLLRDCPVIR